eukprot:5039790-Pyramimonas_sp.AAC.1
MVSGLVSSSIGPSVGDLSLALASPRLSGPSSVPFSSPLAVVVAWGVAHDSGPRPEDALSIPTHPPEKGPRQSGRRGEGHQSQLGNEAHIRARSRGNTACVTISGHWLRC